MKPTKLTTLETFRIDYETEDKFIGAVYPELLDVAETVGILHFDNADLTVITGEDLEDFTKAAAEHFPANETVYTSSLRVGFYVKPTDGKHNLGSPVATHFLPVFLVDGVLFADMFNFQRSLFKHYRAKRAAEKNEEVQRTAETMSAYVEVIMERKANELGLSERDACIALVSSLDKFTKEEVAKVHGLAVSTVRKICGTPAAKEYVKYKREWAADSIKRKKAKK